MTAVAVGSAPAPGIPSWAGYAGAGLLGALALFGLGLGRKTTMKMTAMETSLRTIVVQLIGHIERLEQHIDDQNKRLAESMPKSAYDANSKRRDELEATNGRLSSENAELRKRLAESEESHARDLRTAKAKRR